MGQAITLQKLLEEGTVALWVLIGASVVVLAFIIERIIYYYKRSINPIQLLGIIKEFIKQERYKEAILYCEAKPHFLTNMMRSGLLQLLSYDETREKINWDVVKLNEIESALDTSKIQEKQKLEKYTVVLATFGNMSPFIGLFGTVWGIMNAFEKLSQTENISPNIVMGDISEALIATAFGIGVAVPAVMAYNFFSRKIAASLSEMDIISSNFLQLLKVLKKNNGILPDNYYFEDNDSNEDE